MHNQWGESCIKLMSKHPEQTKKSQSSVLNEKWRGPEGHVETVLRSIWGTPSRPDIPFPPIPRSYEVERNEKISSELTRKSGEMADVTIREKQNFTYPYYHRKLLVGWSQTRSHRLHNNPAPSISSLSSFFLSHNELTEENCFALKLLARFLEFMRIPDRVNLCFVLC